jgi:hypothetical protein
LLAQGRWFSPGTPASSTTKTGRNDIAESGVKNQKSIKSIILIFRFVLLLLLLLLLLIGLTFYVFCTALRVIVLLDRRFINIV